MPIGGTTDCRAGRAKRFDQDRGSQASEQDGKEGEGCSRGMAKLEVVGCNRIQTRLPAPQVFFMERCLSYEALRNNALPSRMLNKSARHALLCRCRALVVFLMLNYTAQNLDRVFYPTGRVAGAASVIALRGKGFICVLAE